MSKSIKLQEVAKKIAQRLYQSKYNRDKGHIPMFMMHTKKEDFGFFFGTKQFNSHWLYGNNKYYIGKPPDKDGHIIVVGSAGSGKSSCIAIPTLESWDGTFFAVDIKGEILKKCKGIQRPTKIFSFSENEEGYSHYDPMYLLREGNPNDLVQNARELAESIIQIPPETQDEFWYKSAQDVLMATLLYIYGLEEKDEETGETMQGDFNMAMSLIHEKTIKELITILNNSKDEIVRKLVNQFRDFNHADENKLLYNIGVELNRHTMIFATDNRIRASFTKSDDMIRWEDLETSNIFIEIPEDKLGQWDGAITLMITQLIRTLERRPEKNYDEVGTKKTPSVLILLDEFPRLGKIGVIHNAVSTLRSKGVTFCLIVQSLSQLNSTYGENEAMIILENCPYKAILNVTVPQNQRLVSDMIGYANVKQTTFSESHSISHGINYGIGVSGTGSLSIGGSSSISRSGGQSWTEMREPIIYPEELATLKDIILLHPEGFCRINKLPYYTPYQIPYQEKFHNVLYESVLTKNKS